MTQPRTVTRTSRVSRAASVAGRQRSVASRPSDSPASERVSLTESEALVAVPLLFSAAAMTAAWLADAAGHSVNPAAVFAASTLAIAFVAVTRSRRVRILLSGRDGWLHTGKPSACVAYR